MNGKREQVRSCSHINLIQVQHDFPFTLFNKRYFKLLDLLTIAPLDDELFVQSVLKTGRAVIVHEAPRSFGAGAEIITRIMEKAFYYLEAPIERVTGFDITMPLFSREKAYLPDAQRIVNAATKVLAA